MRSWKKFTRSQKKTVGKFDKIKRPGKSQAVVRVETFIEVSAAPLLLEILWRSLGLRISRLFFGAEPVHRCQFATGQDFHIGSEAAAPRDPAAHIRWIVFHQKLRPSIAAFRLTVHIGEPR